MRYGKKSLLLGVVFFSCSLVAPPPMFSETKEKMMAEQTVDMSSDELPCSMEAKIRKITVAELSEKVKDFNAGDPLLYALLAILSGAEKDTCYYVEAKDLQKVFLHKSMLDISDSEV